MSMNANFILSGTDLKHYPQDNKNEYLFLGRSNVGKSSLINFIVGRKALARTSQTPGKTVTLNFYFINDDFYIVDAPGYGYARRSKKEIESFGQMIEQYLLNRTQLKKVILLVDSKVGPTEDDKIMYNYLKHFNINIVVVVTKIDKLNQKEKNSSRNRIQAFFEAQKVIYTSSEKKIGLEQLKTIFEGNE